MVLQVGRDTINSSEDDILKQDMPSALLRVEEASRLLEDASAMLKQDPYSGPARKKLIEGSRGILQGTSALLLCFDESEVRKIMRECKKVKIKLWSSLYLLENTLNCLLYIFIYKFRFWII